MTDRAAAPAQLDAVFFRKLFDSAGLPIFACDVRGNILARNPLGEDLLRARRGDERQANLRDVLPKEHHADLEGNLRALVESREPLEFRTRIGLENGETAEYAVWLTVVCDDQRRDMAEMLRMYCTILEKNPNGLDCLLDDDQTGPQAARPRPAVLE